MAYISKNPYTKETLISYDDLSESELDINIQLAKTAFITWRSVSYAQKAKLLFRLASLLDERKETYGKLITQEMGKPISQSIAEVEKCAWVCRYYAEKGAEMLKGRITESSEGKSRVCFHPIGGVLAVMPWNFPFWQVFRQLAPTLMTGNVGLFKHASNVPQCAIAIHNVIIDAGIPEGVFQNIFATYNQIEQLIESPFIQAITLTGSEKAGKHLASIAGKNLKKSLLELGGSDPFIVFNDADMALALENAFLSRFINNGQSCIAAKRFIVHESISHEFITNFKSLIENIPSGDPMDTKSFVGCLVDENAVLTIEKQVDQSLKMGAQCITGGKKDSSNPCFYQPTLIINPPFNSPIWAEEVFGPIAPICTFETDEEALKIANNSKFGLGASVWTNDMDRAEYFSEFLETGIVTINGMVKSEPGLPFGGVKDSGYGRELDLYGIHEFVNIKTVSFKA